MSFTFRRRSVIRLLYVLVFALTVRYFTSSSKPQERAAYSQEIKQHNVLDLMHRPENVLDVQRYKFLQSRMGRDERDDLLGDIVRNGVDDYWERFQKP